MTDPITVILGIVKIAVLVLGGMVSLLAYKSYTRTKIDGLQYFAVGIAIITFGMFLVGVLHHIVGVSTVIGMLIEGLVFCAGFTVMIYALYGR